MTIFHTVKDVLKIKCLKDQNKFCIGPECMAWMYKQSVEPDSKAKRTDTAHGVCGWLYVMAYFRDRNDNQYL